MKHVGRRNPIRISWLILIINLAFFSNACKSLDEPGAMFHYFLLWLAIVGGLLIISSIFALVEGNYGLVIFVLIFEAAVIYGLVVTGKARTPRNQAASEIENKIDDMKDLRSDLKRKNKKIVSLIEEYQSEVRKLEKEILSEKAENRISSYEQAIQNQIIAHNLSLISKKRAYIKKMDGMVPQIEMGINELIYLERDAKTDFKMIKVLGGKEAEDIMNKISGIVQKYLPHAGKLVIEIDESRLESLEKIWYDITKERR